MSGEAKGLDIEQREDLAVLDFCPRGTRGGVKTIELNLMDTRASDGIQIRYDFDRDGWVIMQGSKWTWEEDDPNPGDCDWQEVAFIQSWARDPRTDKDDQP